jgi:hypothetical protein
MWLKKNKDDNNWGQMNKEVARLTQEKKWDEALNLAREMYKYTRDCYGKKDKKTIAALNNIGIVNLLRKDFDEAEAYLLLALQLSEKVSGKYSQHTSMINMNLAKLHSSRARMIQETNEIFGEDEYVN